MAGFVTRPILSDKKNLRRKLNVNLYRLRNLNRRNCIWSDSRLCHLLKHVRQATQSQIRNQHLNLRLMPELHLHVVVGNS